MKKKNLSGKSIFGKNLMATVSVMIVLLILGIFAVVAGGASAFSDTLRSRMGFTVVMSDTATPDDIDNMQRYLQVAQIAASSTYTSADEVMARWDRENGENLIEVFGVNPLGAEFDVTVNAPYACGDSLLALAPKLSAMAGVSDVATTAEVVDVIDNVLDILTMVFLPLAAALIVVSFVLINNTVRLSVHSSRFLIHTMKLVGATGSFIRRPFVHTGLISGLVAGVGASIVLCGMMLMVHRAAPDLEAYTSLVSLAWVFPAMIVTGIVICSIAATLAANKYLSLDYDEMF